MFLLRQITNKRALIVVAIATGLLVSISSCMHTNIGVWTIKEQPHKGMAWAKFSWQNDSMGNKYHEKTAMMIPAMVKGLPYHFTFQFDLGANLTQLYEENIKSATAKYPGFDSRKLSIAFGDFEASTKNCYMRRDYGEQLEPGSLQNSIDNRLGTIGSDMFQNKVLIIDYPNERFSICDTIPAGYKTDMIAMTLDKFGRVILPMQLHNKRFRVLFDNGASIFPLLAPAYNANIYPAGKDTDTLLIQAWGTQHLVTGRMLSDTVVIAGQAFNNIMVYTDQNDTSYTDQFDASTGNAMFFNWVVIVDFKHRQFGVK